MLETDVHHRLSHHDDLVEAPQVTVHEVAPGLVFESAGIRVFAEPTDHSPVHPTMGFRIEAEGKVVAIAGDTVPCEGLNHPVPVPGSEPQWIALAKAPFGGEVLLATDLLMVEA